LYQGLGGAVMLFSREIKNSNGAVIAFQRGLGFTEEQLQGVATVAMSSGKSLVEVQSEIANQAIQLGETFGIPKKLIGKDVAEMINDIDTFGNMTVKQMSKTSVYAKKLGVDVKKMAGVFKAFNNFEDAAIGAAKLSQAFGMNIDAVKQLKAGSPAEIIEDLRSAFFAAGKDAANLNRHELALLATQTGLDQETAKRVFSLENQGVAYEDIANKADDAESAQLTAANAMKQVAKDIKRIVHEVLKMDGAFAEFRKGFEQGFTIMNPKFMNLVKIARDVGFTMRGMGQQFAKAILQLEPVQDVFDGLADFMKGFTGLLKDVAKEFVAWAKAMSTDPVKAGEQLVERLGNVFNKFMDNPKVAGGLEKIKKGISGIATIVLETLSGLVPRAIKKFRELLDKGTEYLRNPDKLKISAAAPQWVKSLMKLFEGVKAQGGPLIDSIKSFFGELFKGDFLDKMGITSMIEKLGRILMKTIFKALSKVSIIGDYFKNALNLMEGEEKIEALRKKNEQDRLAGAKKSLALNKKLVEVYGNATARQQAFGAIQKELGANNVKFTAEGKEGARKYFATIEAGAMGSSKKTKQAIERLGIDYKKVITSQGVAYKINAMDAIKAHKGMYKQFQETAKTSSAGFGAKRQETAISAFKTVKGAQDKVSSIKARIKNAKELIREFTLDELAGQAPTWFSSGAAKEVWAKRLKEVNEAKVWLKEKSEKELTTAVADVNQKTKNLGATTIALGKALAESAKPAVKLATQLKPLEKKGLIGKEGKLIIQRKDQPIEVSFDIKLDAKDIKKIVNEGEVKNTAAGKPTP
jgi:hypothetical protein